MNDPYERLAYDYDEFGDISNYLGDEKIFFETLIKRYNVKSVLDCACGTGQHLYMMNELGIAVKVPITQNQCLPLRKIIWLKKGLKSF